MKYGLGILSAAVGLSACVNQASPDKETVSIANPASEFCIKQGGESEIRKNQDGSEYGVCRLPNGQVVEEWEYFRAHNK